MTRSFPIRNLLCFLTLAITTTFATANSSSKSDDYGFITREQALACIQLNKDMNLASEQMLETEEVKALLSSKVSYFEKEINKRRQLIEKLDQNSTRQNNKNYNRLVTQFEDLLLERKYNIKSYEKENRLHVTQHESVVRLEKRFSSQCLSAVKMNQDLHSDVCKTEKIRWCNFFSY